MSAPEASGPPIAQVSSGRLRGSWRESTAVFLGVPFAAPPTGLRRFDAPAPVTSWTGTRDATEYGPTTDRIAVPDHSMPETVVPGEATLNLNVFAPDFASSENAGRPVLVWIHGGGFIVGSPKNLWYEGGSFTRKGIIVVTVDYRLGIDGFGAIDGAPDNRGVRDWIAALEWVRDNIGAFGGDPDRVTVAGQSAGGGAVLTLLGTPAAQHLFRAAIALSGALGDGSRAKSLRFTADLAHETGVEPNRAGLSRVPEHDLLKAQMEIVAARRGRDRFAAARDLFRGVLPIAPIVDGELLPMSTPEALSAGVGADKPLLLVTTDDENAQEASRWLPAAADLLPRGFVLRRTGLSRAASREFRRAHPGLRPRRLLGRLVADLTFRVLALEVAAARGEGRTWLARLKWPSPTFGQALHCLDLPFFFDILDEPSAASWLGADPPKEIAEALHGAAVHIILGEQPAWQAWDSRAGAIAVLDRSVEIEADAYHDVRYLGRRLT
ncbi:carboxylesterase family protein [Leifsonia sp. ZF2019]|uniref:carboxylesterase/lipase family protein n=1 Tax=Leifsonia sp. ZF2019 TaxID=2781978 RepID=UPI001CBE3524|nr:carboxylesterase family protein [Leifsonia sp. ZF2019]UAJ79324.1 carboxylesterase family protein [Leifsonia sp. ZF2019]